MGDPEKPKLVFFFDEAHLLFDDAPKALLEKIEQVVRLIRSKGVGVYFVTQNPLDLPESVLGQLGNRVQHALRAFTPKDQKAVKTAADTLRPNPKLEGRARDHRARRRRGAGLAARRERRAAASSSARSSCRPASQIGPITDDERAQLVRSSPVFGKYENAVDRESAYEKLNRAHRGEAGAAGAQLEPGLRYSLRQDRAARRPAIAGRGRGNDKSAARSIGSELGRQMLRGVLGSILGGSKRR